MDKNDLPVLGIDLGGTKISAALIKNRQVVGEAARVSTPTGPQNIIEAIVGLVEHFSKDNLLLGVGIATAGSVDPEAGKVVGATGNLPGWTGTPVKQIIESKTALLTHVENDANAAAFGEFAANPSWQGKACIVTVTLGTGIGVGTVIGGRVFRGSHFASQAGHVRIAMSNRRRCTCGLWDCWEAFGCGGGLVRTAWEALSGISESQSTLAAQRESLTTRDIIAAAEAGDLIAQKVMETWHEHIVLGMVSLAHSFDPDVFILGGGLSKFVKIDLIKEMLTERTLPMISENLQLMPARLGENAGMVGAAELVRLENHKDRHLALS